MKTRLVLGRAQLSDRFLFTGRDKMFGRRFYLKLFIVFVCFVCRCLRVRWSVSEWSKCSASCGAGQKRRWVTCQQLDAGGTARTLPAAACEGTSRPADTEPCSANNCPVWVTSPWGKVESDVYSDTLHGVRKSPSAVTV